MVIEFKAKTATNTIDQTPYSPDLAHATFLFPKLKLLLRGTRFESIEEIKRKSWLELKSLQKASTKDVSKNGKNAGKCVLHQTERTLKVTT